MTSSLLTPPRSEHAADRSARPARTVVVAVDGGPASIAALTWARDALIDPTDRIRIVTAYSSPIVASEVPIRTEDIHDARESAQHAAAIAVRTVFGTDRPGAVTEHVVAFGPIEAVLDKHASDVAFVVVGTRRRRRWRERLRGSTTNRVTGRLTCPVVSIPEPDADIRSAHHPSVRPTPPADTS